MRIGVPLLTRRPADPLSRLLAYRRQHERHDSKLQRKLQLRRQSAGVVGEPDLHGHSPRGDLYGDRRHASSVRHGYRFTGRSDRYPDRIVARPEIP